MVIWRSKVETESEPSIPQVGQRSWRWDLDVGVGHIDLHQYVHFEKPKPRWLPGSRYFNVSVTKHFFLGPDHTWYDGPHCSFSVGFVHFNWSNNDCKRCSGER